MTDYALLIDGVATPGEHDLEVRNPATGELITHASRASRAQLDQAVEAARRAFPSWARTSPEERRAALVAIADVIGENADELARLLTTEHGKPLAESRREVGGMAAFFRFAATVEMPARSFTDSDGRSVHVERVPLGPVAAIIPWNFPLLTIAFKLPWALAAGNTVVVKASPTTPLATLRWADLVAPVLPAGVLNVIVDDNDLGDALTSHPGIRKVSFTGSTATGKKVMSSAIDTLKRLTLELGGNDCAIVLPDADPAQVAPGIFRAAFANNGQVCLAIKRLYVHEDLYDDVCDELVRLAEAAVVGDGLDENTTLGPVQNERQFSKLRGLLEVAHRDGRVLTGGHAGGGPGFFIEPTIVADIAEGSPLVDEEQFGPILPVIRYRDVDEVLARANNTDFGLGASVWSADLPRAEQVARRIDAGTVWINKHADIAPNIPFGGAKQSGVGVEFAAEGLAEFTQLRVINGPSS